MEVIVRQQASGERLVTCGPLIVRVLDGGPTEIEHVDAAGELIEQQLEQYSAIALLVLIEHGTAVPPLAVSRYAAERFGSYGDRVLIGVCVLGLGFWAKAAFNSMTIAVRFAGTTVVLETDLETFAQRVSLDLVGVDPDVLLALLEQQRAELRAQRSAVG